MTDLQPSEECEKEVIIVVLTVPVSSFVCVFTMTNQQLSLQLSSIL